MQNDTVLFAYAHTAAPLYGKNARGIHKQPEALKGIDTHVSADRVGDVTYSVPDVPFHRQPPFVLFGYMICKTGMKYNEQA